MKFLLIFCLILLVIINPNTNKFLKYNDLTSIKDIVDVEDSIIDFIGRIFGIKKLAADYIWIRMLQYYAGHDFNYMDEKNYPDLIKYFKRITMLSPDWSRSVEWGVGVLAFNHKRYSEAMELLKLGIKFRPNYTRFYMYVGAIGYLSKNMEIEAISILEKIVENSDSLTALNILANIYKKNGRYNDAIRIYERMIEVAESIGAYYSDYVEHAKRNINMLKYIK
ncbi:MAG: tetratricopeptide repeat protein [bacterium]|nr:tetratricopeptide repeat protein [bacterium]